MKTSLQWRGDDAIQDQLPLGIRAGKIIHPGDNKQRHSESAGEACQSLAEDALATRRAARCNATRRRGFIGASYRPCKCFTVSGVSTMPSRLLRTR